MKPKALIDNLVGRSGGGGEGRSWGRSPRPSADDLPEWAREFQGAEWTATPNPRASKSKRQRRARLIMRCMLASLPLSLVSCLMSVASRSSSAPVAPVAAPAAETPQAQSQAQTVVQRWLAGGGLQVLSMTWQGFEQSHLSCAPQPADGETQQQPLQDYGAAPGDEPPKCEEHLFKVQISRLGSRKEHEWVQVQVTIDPLTGVVAGAHIKEEESELSSERPVWERQPGRSEAELTDALLGVLGDRAAEWASAWASGWKHGSQETLRELAGETDEESDGPPVGKAWLGLPGWEAIPGSLSILSTLQVGPPGGGATGASSPHLVTVEFEVAQRCVNIEEGFVDSEGYKAVEDDYYPPRCDECPDPASSDEDGDARGSFTVLDSASDLAVCGGILLSVSADLHVEIDKGEDTVTVRDYGEVGAFDPAQILRDRQAQSAAV